MKRETRPLIAHVVYSFDIGGLENGIVNLINHLDPAHFRHAIVALTRCSPTFCERITREDVEFFDLEKPPGHGIKLYPKLSRLFGDLQPAIVHTRNLAALEAAAPAWFKRVPVRIHGEHGWDISDPGGKSLKFQWMRRLYRPFVSHYIGLSGQLASYLESGVGVPAAKITRICNGVDTTRFHPSEDEDGRSVLEGSPFNRSELFVIGTVGRLQAVKDQLNLVRAFARLMQIMPNHSRQLRLMLVGDGPLRAQVEAEVAHFGLGDRVWLAGARSDIPEVIRAMDLFVLPSRAEGISNTILEALASGVPVVATNVGGSSELVEHGQCGGLVPPNDSEALAGMLANYVRDRELCRAHGRAARIRAEEHFSIKAMVDAYQQLYLDQLTCSGRIPVAPLPHSAR